MKIFISADIEGTNGIAHWNETEMDKGEYRAFANKMTDEVNAVCTGINKAEPSCEIFLKDAHDSGRNIDHQKLPQNVTMNRSWARAPYSMMDGIDKSFDATIFTGYHSGAGSNGNLLAHTMHRQLIYVKINGMYASECLLNYYASLYNGVPVVMVSGDEALCETVKQLDPNIYTVTALKGRGGSATAEHPDKTKQKLLETAEIAVKNRDKMSLKLPETFKTEIYFKEHFQASRAAYYPGAYMVQDHCVGYETNDYFDFLTYFMFVR